MLLAMAAVVAAFVAWPYLQPSLRPAQRVASRKQVAAVVDRGESPRVRQPSRDEKKQQEPQRVKDPLISASPDLAARDRAPAEREMATTAAETITPPPKADQADARLIESVARTITDAAEAFRSHDYAAAEKALDETARKVAERASRAGDSAAAAEIAAANEAAARTAELAQAAAVGLRKAEEEKKALEKIAGDLAEAAKPRDVEAFVSSTTFVLEVVAPPVPAAEEKKP
jgi:hypothetical protein